MRGIVPRLAQAAQPQINCRITARRGFCAVEESSAAASMTQIQPAAQPTFSGKSSGGIPNLFWRRISHEQLRAQAKYHGLPPVEQLQFESTADYRQVRQDTQLWNTLHQGLLTTGKLNAALGFYEPGAARRLGIPRDRINHGSLLSAIANLKQPAWGLAALNLPATPAAPPISPPESVLAPHIPKASEYEAAASKLANSTQPGPLPGGRTKADKNRQRRLRKKQHFQMEQQQAAHNAAACDSANPTPFTVEAESLADVYASADARRKRCITVADRGEGGIRMAWGSAQEASALFSLMHLYPSSQLEEVGLCWVDPRHQIPASWGIPVNDLPPLGASPDGLMKHQANSAPLLIDLPAPSSLLHLTSHGQAGPPPDSSSVQSAPSMPTAQASGVEIRNNQEAVPPAVDAEFEALLSKLALSAMQAPAWSPAQQSGLAQSHSTHPGAFFQQPAAAHAQRQQPSSSALQSATVSTSAYPNVAPQQPATASVQSGTESAVDGANAESRQHDWFEAVEIKNVCPFRELRHISSNGKARRVYQLSDPGPYSRVPCHFVPQLQMEMLASGAQSALVVSRSATKGMRIFRMHRHEQFLQQMLRTISQLYKKYVRTDSSPPVNMFFEQAAYQQFLGTTLHVAESVQVISDLDYQTLPDVQDSTMFL